MKTIGTVEKPHADDLSPFDGFATGPGDALTERTLAAKEATGHRLVDDEDLWGSEGVAVVEGASFEYAGADGFEIVGTDAVDGGDGLMAGLRRLATCNEILAGLGQTEEGHRVGDAGGCDTESRSSPRQLLGSRRPSLTVAAQGVDLDGGADD